MKYWNPAGFSVSRISDVLNLELVLQDEPPDLLIWDGRENREELSQLLSNFNLHHPDISVILLWMSLLTQWRSRLYARVVWIIYALR
jgi:DNA-binding NtrC family response regulator